MMREGRCVHHCSVCMSICHLPWLQATKASFGRFSSRSTSSVASSTDDDSIAEAKAAATSVEPDRTAIRPAEQINGATDADVPLAAQDPPDPVDGRLVDALLAEGGDADVVTGEPLLVDHRARQDRTADSAVVSMPAAGFKQQAPAEQEVSSPAQATAAGTRPEAESANAAPGSAAAGSAASPQHYVEEQPQTRRSAQSSADAGVLLTAANLAKLRAESTPADDQGISGLQGQLDGRGRCRLDKM